MKRRGFLLGSAALAAAPIFPAFPVAKAAALVPTAAGVTSVAQFGGEYFFLSETGFWVYRKVADSWAYSAWEQPETQANTST